MDNSITSDSEKNLSGTLKGKKRRKYSRFVLAALSSIPWVGGFLSASAAMDAENEQQEINEVHKLWVEEHQDKMNELGETLNSIISRLEGFDDDIKARMESPNYLALIRKGFRVWDESDTKEKREYVRRLLTNAGATKLCPDDLVRLFLDWIAKYHEAHFLVIKEIYKNPGTTRGQIWDRIHGERPREDSSEADLYKLLIRDLSTGSVIRQHRPTNAYGQFIKKSTEGRKKTSGSGVMKSAFDNMEPYELTELGQKFVHYTMEDVVTQVEGQ